MILMILRRLLAAWFTLAVIAVVVFFGVELMPGDACTAYLGRDGRGPVLEACRERMGLTTPAPERFVAWAGKVLTGDLGTSMQREKPITSIIGWRLRNTLILAAAAALIGVPIAIALGFLTGLKRDGPTDLIVSTTALVAMTLPEFVLATVLILLFAITLGWTAGIVTASYNAPALDLLLATPLPAMTLALIMMAHIMRMVRASVIEVMDSDYVLMARLKGVPRRRIVWRHILPNALLPTISLIGLTLAWLLSGVLIVESVFNYPGLGRLAVNAVSDRDLPLVQAIALLFGGFYVLTTLLSDLTAMALNPRLRTYRS
jgi:peptide/nickel transport system permease protein